MASGKGLIDYFCDSETSVMNPCIMKILSITNLCHGYSASLPERALYKGLKEKGAELTVITHFPTPETREVEDAGIRVIYLPIRKKFNPGVIRAIRRIIIENNIEILHITFGKALTNSLIASIGIPCRKVAYLGSIRVHWHDPFAWVSYLNPRVDKLICLSRGVEEHIVRQAPWRMKGKTVQIYKGYDPAWFAGTEPVKRESLGIPPDGFIVCCVANVRKVKGLPWLIEATSLIRLNLPVYLLLIGPGMDSPEIRELISASPYRNNFRTFGFTDNIFSYVAMSDLYIQPSVSEGLGRSVIEAMFLARPVVVTGQGGVCELVDEGVNGYYIRVPSASAIAEKIMFCMNNRNLMQDMGKKGRQKVSRMLKPETMIVKTYDLFRSILEGDKTPGD